MKKAPKLFVIAGAVALAWAAPTVVSGADGPNRAGTVTAVAGPVTLTRPEATPQPLKFRDTLFWRDVVEARKDGMARVLLGGTTTVTVRELSGLALRQEATVDGVRYTVELMSGKVRVLVARMLMRPGEQVEVRTRNAVASVRGTDFIVETVERPAAAGAFGLLGVLEVAQGVGDSAARSGDTVVVTLSGVVEVSNRLGGTGRVARIGGYQAALVNGRQDPVGFQITAGDFKRLLQGLTPPRPPEARSVDKAEAVANKVEQVALATSAQSVRVLEQAGQDGSRRIGSSSGGGKGSGQLGAQGSGQGSQQGNSQDNTNRSDIPPSSQSSSKVDMRDNGQSNASVSATPAVAATPAVPATPPVAPTDHGNGQGDGNGLALGHGNGPGTAAAPATPAVAATAATPAAPAAPPTSPTPATPATPSAAATPAVPGTPAATIAAPVVPATPATGAVAATPATPAAPAANAGHRKGVGPASGKGNSGTPPGQAKK